MNKYQKAAREARQKAHDRAVLEQRGYVFRDTPKQPVEPAAPDPEKVAEGMTTAMGKSQQALELIALTQNIQHHHPELTQGPVVMDSDLANAVSALVGARQVLEQQVAAAAEAIQNAQLLGAAQMGQDGVSSAYQLVTSAGGANSADHMQATIHHLSAVAAETSTALHATIDKANEMAQATAQAIAAINEKIQSIQNSL